MKVKTLSIEGFSSDLAPDDRPSLSIHGIEGVGKTRLAMTAPDPIGLLALDKKSKRTAEAIGAELGKVIIANQKPFLPDTSAIKLATVDGDTADGLKQIKDTYTLAVKNVLESGMRLAEHKDIQTIVLDTGSQFFDWILFSHFGRRNQITPTSRGAANQDMIDFVNALRSKHLIIIHRSKEIWKKTGENDKQGKPIKEPSGKFEVDGFNKIGGFVTATIELTNNKAPTDDLDKKFRVKVVTCQTKPLLEGQDLSEYEVKGDSITWDNIAMVMGF